jgi:hypothetical protein
MPMMQQVCVVCYVLTAMEKMEIAQIKKKVLLRLIGYAKGDSWCDRMFDVFFLSTPIQNALIGVLYHIQSWLLPSLSTKSRSGSPKTIAPEQFAAAL